VTGSVSDDMLAGTLGADEVALLRGSLRALLQESASTGSLIASLADLGWDDVVAESPEASALLFEEQGRSGVPSGLLDRVMLDASGLAALEGVAVLYPLPGPGRLFDPAAGTVAGHLSAAGIVRSGADQQVPDQVVAPVLTDGATTLVRIPGRLLETARVDGLDPAGNWMRVAVTIPLDGVEPLDVSAPQWVAAVAAGRRALSAELIGLAQRALDVAVETVSGRHQFGRAVGSFQAVRFRLADAKVAIESASELLRLAFSDPDPLVSATAKALAGIAADVTVRQAMQVCGAMGLTWEFPLHHSYRRAAALDGLLGDTDSLTTAIGGHVATASVLPQLEPFASSKCPAPTPANLINRPRGR
jgi:hypothetical protein